MKLLFITLISLFTTPVFLQSGCSQTKLDGAVPSCIQRMIKKIKAEPVRNPPAQIWKWEADGKTYYYVTADCCDQFNYLYDDHCHVVCAPDGGFTGRGDGKCPDFKGEVKKTLIWQDRRK